MREINDRSFEMEVMKGNILIDFYGVWCGPCKRLQPILENLSKEIDYVDFLKIDVDKNNESVLKTSVLSLPTILFLKDGKEVSRIIGCCNKETIFNTIKRSYG